MTLNLDKVIKKIDKAVYQDCKDKLPKTKKIVVIDAKSGQSLDEKRFSLSFSQQRIYFLVGNENNSENFVISEIRKLPITDFASGRSIDINVRYRVSCHPGNEQAVALALFDKEKKPGEIFEDKLFSWLNKIKFSDITTNFTEELLENLANKIVNTAKETGLNLELSLKLELDESKRLKPYSPNSDNFSVLLKDFEEEVPFKFETRLIIPEDGKINAILNYNNLENLEGILQESIRDYLHENISLYDFCYKFDESVRSGLISYLDKNIKAHGRKIEVFTPKIFESLRIPEIDQINHDVECDIKGYRLIKISNTLKIEPIPKEILKYRKHGKTDILSIEEWFRKELSKTIKDYFFDWRYDDIVVLREHHKKEIKQLLNKKTQEIGYSVKIITTTSDIKASTLETEGFRCSIQERSFSTKQNSVKVKLGIEIRGRIEDLEKIKNILSYHQEVEDLIEKDVIDVVSDILHDVEPEVFYFHFENDINPQEISIKKRLIAGIEKILINKFYVASPVNLTLKMIDTDLIQRFNELKSKPCEFEVYIGSTKDSEEIVRYNGSFSIERVDKDMWHQFQARSERTIESIKQELEKQLHSCFRTSSSTKLIYTTAEQAEKILEEVNKFAKQYVIREFGLIITILRFGRDDTEIERLKRETLQEIRADELQKFKEQMKNQKELRSISFNSSINQVEEIKAELAIVRSHLQNIATLPSVEERLKYKQQEADLQRKLDEFLHTNQEASKQIISQQISTLAPSPVDDEF